MRCLHICNDLLGSKVHENLYFNLQNLGNSQTLYYPLRKNKIQKVEALNDDLKNLLLISKPLNTSHRLFFRKKINHLFKDLKEQVDFSQYNIAHATTLFSDGAVALRIWKQYGVPYIVAIRGTDVNLFLKYRFDLYPLAKEIICNAKQLVFISDSLKKNFINSKFIATLNHYKIPNCQVIVNGLDPFWIQNTNKKKNLKRPTKFLYIGKFNANKNVLRLVHAFLKINREHKNLELNLVGHGGNQEKAIKKIAIKNEHCINFHGPIYDKKELQQMYLANDVFVMTSISETFGLVYVEALTQGLPILFTENQGIDGTFKERVGEAVNPKSINSIQQGLGKLFKNYHEYEIDKIDFSKFSWNRIAKTYHDLYQTFLKEK
ncbi:glycosyltransferase family 4 protein [Winogradskyella sp.]|uniref:glycosyltransferase family 4 protein n=1 Tax=Winogradskyella sp. TaxID=1883156 RepID=UPI00261AB3F3|nr:glycosyltransferase family 4 protein [Winogradskyella sp.]